MSKILQLNLYQKSQFKTHLITKYMEPYDRNLMLVQYLDALVPNMNIFEEMKQAGNGKFSYGTGSYLIDGKNYSYDNMTMDKQVLLFWAAKRAH